MHARVHADEFQRFGVDALPMKDLKREIHEHHRSDQEDIPPDPADAHLHQGESTCHQEGHGKDPDDLALDGILFSARHGRIVRAYVLGRNRGFPVVGAFTEQFGLVSS